MRAQAELGATGASLSWRGSLGVTPSGRQLPDNVGRTVLVVDDEPELREQTQQMLERNGDDAVVVGDGQSALALSRHHRGTIDLLLTDVVMPAMQGTELADAIRLQRPGIVVVSMTGYSKEALGDPGMRPEALGDPGMRPVALVEKPFDEQTLLGLLRRHLPDSPGQSGHSFSPRRAGGSSSAQARRQADASGPRCAVSAPSTGATALTDRRACHQSECTSRDRVATAASTRSENRWAFSPSSGVMGAPKRTAMGERRSRPPRRDSVPDPPGALAPASDTFGST